MYLSEGSAAARDLCDELGVSQASFYRHIKGHLPLNVTTPPKNQRTIDWTRAVVNLASAVETYRIVRVPEDISYLNIGVGSDEKGKFVELLIVYVGDALDENSISTMSFEIGLEMEFIEIVPGNKPTRQMTAKLRAEEIFVGRKKVKRDDK